MAWVAWAMGGASRPRFQDWGALGPWGELGQIGKCSHRDHRAIGPPSGCSGPSAACEGGLAVQRCPGHENPQMEPPAPMSRVGLATSAFQAPVVWFCAIWVGCWCFCLRFVKSLASDHCNTMCRLCEQNRYFDFIPI